MTKSNRYEAVCDPVYGGFGHTTVCRDIHLDRNIIIKRINDPLETHRLLDEIHALQKAKSKHVVQIYDIIPSEDGTEIAIIEEFLPGTDLIDFRANDGNIHEFVQILYQLSGGLADIHDCGIVHRDFKPNNVKYDAEKILKIFDFGLAKYEVLPASTVGVIGTPGFMAPELFRDPPVIDKPVDCYAFGATAFYFVTGSPPGCAKHKPLPRALRPEESISGLIKLSNNISTLVDQCLAITPANRPSMKSIRDEIEKELLFGTHKATIVLDNQIITFDQVGKVGRIHRSGIDFLKIQYDGYRFTIIEIGGDVFINAVRATAGQILDGSCVISLGATNLGASRKFVTFDISHPEVVL